MICTGGRVSPGSALNHAMKLPPVCCKSATDQARGPRADRNDNPPFSGPTSPLLRCPACGGRAEPADVPAVPGYVMLRSPEARRVVRAVEVLERIGTAEARAVLQGWSRSTRTRGWPGRRRRRWSGWGAGDAIGWPVALAPPWAGCPEAVRRSLYFSRRARRRILAVAPLSSLVVRVEQTSGRLPSNSPRDQRRISPCEHTCS